MLGGRNSVSLIPPPWSHSSFPVSSSFSQFYANNKKSTKKNRCCLQAKLIPLRPFPHTYPAPRLIKIGAVGRAYDIVAARLSGSAAVVEKTPLLTVLCAYDLYVTAQIAVMHIYKQAHI